MTTKGLVIAIPKGRLQDELTPLLQKVGIYPEQAFFDDSERQLQFACKGTGMTLVRARAFDVATFVAFGAAHMGITGLDVLMEFNYDDLYAPLDLNIGHCRLCVAEPEQLPPQENLARASHVRVATKYPNVSRSYFAGRGIQAECIKLSGAIELAPRLGLAHHIVDLVSTGQTLKANGLREVETIAKIASRLIVNRAAFKTRAAEIGGLIDRFREAVHAA